jgi:hypothetical protein
LREVLEDGLLWQSHDRLKAIRLLGRQPLDAVDDKRVIAIYLFCWAMEPGKPHGFDDLLPELTPKERPVYFERLNAREPLGAMPEGPEAARAELLALIAQEEERLEGVLAAHLEREEAEAAAEQAFDATTYGERLRGYEASNDRLLVRIVEALRKRHQEAGGTTSSGGRAARRASIEGTKADRCCVKAIAAPPEEIAPSDEWAPERVVSDPGVPAPVPADSPPTETAGDNEWEANVLTEEEIRYRNARTLEVLGCGPPVPTEEASNQVPSEEPGPDPARTEPRPTGDPMGGSPGLNDGAIEVRGANDRVPRIPPNGTNRPVAPARRLAEALLALFALIGATGLPATSARPVFAPTAASPGGPIGRVLAPWSSHNPTWAVWLCSSRAPDDPVVVPHEGRESRPIPASPR